MPAGTGPPVRRNARLRLGGRVDRVLGDRVLFTPGRAEVPLLDHETEQEVVHDRVAEADRDEPDRSVRLAEVQHVVDRTGREREADFR